MDSPRYSELYSQRFLDAFPPMPMEKLNTHRKLVLKELKKIADDITLEAGILDLFSDKSEDEIEKVGIKEEMSQARKRWGEKSGFSECAEKLRLLSGTEGWYSIEPDQLSVDDVAVLVLYPFWSRMGGSFEEQFALDGRLGKYLRILKEKTSKNY